MNISKRTASLLLAAAMAPSLFPLPGAAAPAAPGVAINRPAGVSYVGESDRSLVAAVSGAGAGQGVTWSVSPENLVSVVSESATEIVYSSVAAGTATFTATSAADGSLAASATVEIRANTAAFNTNLTNLAAVSGNWRRTEGGMSVVAGAGDVFCMSDTGAGKFTFETDVKTTRAVGLIIGSKTQNPVIAGDTGSSYLLQLDVFSGSPSVRAMGFSWDGFDQAISVPYLKADEWYRIKAEVDGPDYKFYVDGALLLEGRSTATAAASADGGLLGLYANNCVALFQNTFVTLPDGAGDVSGVLLPEGFALEIGAARTVAATVLPPTARDRGVIWSVSPPGIVSLADDGEGNAAVTALMAGEATLTATSRENAYISGSCAISVLAELVHPDIKNPSFESGADGWAFIGADSPKQPLQNSAPGYDGRRAFHSGEGPAYFIAGGKLNYQRSDEGDHLGVIEGGGWANVSIEADLTLSRNTLFGFTTRMRDDGGFNHAYVTILVPDAGRIRHIRIPYNETNYQTGINIPYDSAFHVKFNFFEEGAGKRVQVYIDDMDAPAYSYLNMDSTITGTHVGLFTFRGSGSVDNLKIYDATGGTRGELLYEDGFEDPATAGKYIFRSGYNASSASGYPKLTAISDKFVANGNYLEFTAGGRTDSGTYVALEGADGTELERVIPGAGGAPGLAGAAKYYFDTRAHIGAALRIRIVDGSEEGYLVADAFGWAARKALGGVSLLTSQVGFHTRGAKKFYLRSASASPPADPAELAFDVLDGSGESVFCGPIRYWGEKWGTYWWEGDFGALESEGAYTVSVDGGALTSNPFHIRDDVLANSRLDGDPASKQADLADIAMNQLDGRLSAVSAGRDIPGFPAGSVAPGWRDCGSDIRELSSMVVTIHALVDMYFNESIYGGLSAEEKAKLKEQIIYGADYVAYSQELSANPLTNGRFDHDAAHQTDYGTSDYHSWHDTAYGITGLMRAYEAVRDSHPQKAAQYLASAALAYENAVYRPYNLESDLWGMTDDDGNRIGASQLDTVLGLARLVYDMPPSWNFPTELKTKDKLTFTWACALLYSATSDPKYLATAKQYANEAAGRQFLDWENPIDGAFGNFYAFEGTDDAFLLEWNQNHRFHMGNIEPTNLKGFMELYRLSPGDPDRAKWYNAVKTYADSYAKRTALLSPLGIYPLTAYKNPQHGGVSFFQVSNHGFTGMYGQIAKNFMEIGDFLEDCGMQALAENNLQFVAGLNPGIPTSYDEREWTPQSLILGLGSQWFTPKTALFDAPIGSGVNGFSATPQFSATALGAYPDAPKGFLDANGGYQFNEDYLPHSHGYVSGVSLVEGGYSLTIRALDGGRPVAADVTVRLGQSARSYRTAPDGTLAIKDLPLMENGTVTAEYGGMIVARDISTIGSGKKALNIDFAEEIDVSISAPAQIRCGAAARGELTLSNRSRQAHEVTAEVSAFGVAVGGLPRSVTLAAGESRAIPFEISAAGSATTYTIIADAYVADAFAAGAAPAGAAHEAIAGGKVGLGVPESGEPGEGRVLEAIPGAGGLYAIFGNFTGSDVDAALVAAVYDAGGRLALVESVKEAVAASGELRHSFEFDAADYSGMAYKVFAWDGGSAAPLADSAAGAIP